MGCGSSHWEVLAFLADLLPPASSAKRKALLHRQFPKVVVLTAVWLCRKHHCLRHLAFTSFFFFSFLFSFFFIFFFHWCAAEILFPHPSLPGNILAARIIFLSTTALARCAQALLLQILQMSPSLKTGKNLKIPSRAQAGRRSAEPAPCPAVPRGLSAVQDSPGERRVGERWGDFFQQHFADVAAASLALCAGLVSILLFAEHFIDKNGSWLKYYFVLVGIF